VQEVPIVAYCVGEYVTPHTYEIITGTLPRLKKFETFSQQRR
jgi:hypothetical protein